MLWRDSGAGGVQQLTGLHGKELVSWEVPEEPRASRRFQAVPELG